MSKPPQPERVEADSIQTHLKYLKLPFLAANHEAIAGEAAQRNWSHVEFFARLIEGEANMRSDRATQRRVRAARFPVVKTIDDFQWSWPKKLNRLQVQNLFRMAFVREKANVIFLGGVGMGKTHLATAIGHAACLKGHRVLYTTAIDAINTLNAAQTAGRLKPELNRLLKPDLLILDELGYLPIDKSGADLLFQIFSHRYEQGSIVITSNRAYKDWAKIFNDDPTLTSAILDRLLHHAETILIEGKSYRMKGRIEG